jgi:hypothetical protein
MTLCYVLMDGTAAFDTARAACQALGGASDLVSYTTGAPALEHPGGATEHQSSKSRRAGHRCTLTCRG